jgi:hypothetical protein
LFRESLTQHTRGTPNAWGYSTAGTADELADRYDGILRVVRNLALLAGFCYTQFADTYQEANGLLYADRTPKVPLKRIAAATAGGTAARSDGLEQLRATLDPNESH